MYGKAIHPHGDGNGGYAWVGEQVFLCFYVGDEEADDQRDDAGRLQDDEPCFYWVLFFEKKLFRDLLLVMHVSVT